MQNKKSKNQSKKAIRHMHERIGAIVLVLGTIVGVSTVNHEARSVFGQLAVRPAFAVVEHTAKENETARMPVSLDSALRGATIGGQ